MAIDHKTQQVKLWRSFAFDCSRIEHCSIRHTHRRTIAHYAHNANEAELPRRDGCTHALKRLPDAGYPKFLSAEPQVPQVPACTVEHGAHELEARDLCSCTYARQLLLMPTLEHPEAISHNENAGQNVWMWVVLRKCRPQLEDHKNVFVLFRENVLRNQAP